MDLRNSSVQRGQYGEATFSFAKILRSGQGCRVGHVSMSNGECMKLVDPGGGAGQGKQFGTARG